MPYVAARNIDQYTVGATLPGDYVAWLDAVGALADMLARRDIVIESADSPAAAFVVDNDDESADSVALSYRELQAIARDAGLPATGTRDALAARLRAAGRL